MTHCDIASRWFTDSVGLDLDDTQQFATALLRLEHEVGKPRGAIVPDRHRLLVAGIDRDLELSLVLRLQQANHPIVLELLADGPHEDWAQYNLRRKYIRRPLAGKKTGGNRLNIA